MSTWNAQWVLAKRELKRFYRQRSRLIGSLVSPLVFWIFLGGGLGSALPIPETPLMQGYREYFFPGMVAMVILFTSIFSNISVIEDRHTGFLQSVRVSPLPPYALVGGKVFGTTLLAVLQALLFLCLAPLAGFSLFHPGIFLAVTGIFAMSFSLSALGFFFAWKLDSVQGFHSIMNIVLMPLWLLSGAFFPYDKATPFLKGLMLFNPLSYGLSLLKSGLYGHEVAFAVAPEVALAVTLLFGILFLGLSALLVAKTEEVRT